MIDVPENLQRLSSFLHRGPASGARLTLGRELAAAEASAVADLELEARSLLKHMSIGEAPAGLGVGGWPGGARRRPGRQLASGRQPGEPKNRLCVC